MGTRGARTAGLEDCRFVSLVARITKPLNQGRTLPRCGMRPCGAAIVLRSTVVRAVHFVFLVFVGYCQFGLHD